MKEEIENLKQSIDAGIAGKSIWIPLLFPKMGQCVGIGKKIQTIIGGMSGTGKTAFTDLAYVLGPYSWMLKNKDSTDIEIRIIYRSMERSKTHKLAKWVCLRLYNKYGIIIDVPTLLGWGIKKNKIAGEIYDKIEESYKYFDDMLEYVEIIDGTMNPTGIYKHVQEYANTIGKEEEIPYTTKEGIKRTKKVYNQYNDKIVTIIVIDHIGKLKGEHVDKNSKIFLPPQSKGLMDKMSDYCGSEFRDFYGFNPVIVSQFNRGIEDTMRRVKTDNSPLPSDFKNSSNLYEDADVALALYNPYKLGDDNNLGYDIPKFVDGKGYNRFRSCYVLKNSYGNDDIAFGYRFQGEVGMMTELPRSDEDYSKYI